MTDNIRTLLGAINSANNDNEIDGLIVSLDAKKAFDSVEHVYIETVLKKLGLKDTISKKLIIGLGSNLYFRIFQLSA